MGPTNCTEQVIPKLADPDSCCAPPHRDIHCKNLRWSNGIWAALLSADGAADESVSPQFGIRHCPQCRGEPASTTIAPVLFGAIKYIISRRHVTEGVDQK